MHTDSSHTLEVLLQGIDQGIEAHLAWNRRLLRCALLHELPGDDVSRLDAHMLCKFGVWFSSHRSELGTFDEALVERIAVAHRDMHDAVRSMCLRVLQGQPADPVDLRAYEQGQASMVASLNHLRARVVASAARQDPLTGLPLRHGIEYTFGLRHKDARRGGAQFWLAMIDVDHFKSVNDRHGHAVGDFALRHIAACLAGCLRETDALFRFGGEEFLGLFLVHESQDARAVAARLLDAVNAAPLTTPSGVTLCPTVTVGMARVRADEGLPGAIERADRAMLLGKAQGRGRFVIAPD